MAHRFFAHAHAFDLYARKPLGYSAAHAALGDAVLNRYDVRSLLFYYIQHSLVHRPYEPCVHQPDIEVFDCFFSYLHHAARSYHRDIGYGFYLNPFAVFYLRVYSIRQCTLSVPYGSRDVALHRHFEHFLKLALRGRGIYLHIRHSQTVCNIVHALMGFAVRAHKARPVYGEDHVQPLQRHIVEHLVVSPL